MALIGDETALDWQSHDPLSAQQRARAAAAYEVARRIVADDPLPEDITVVAHWIVTGQQPQIVRADQRQVERAVTRIHAADTDAARWYTA